MSRFKYCVDLWDALNLMEVTVQPQIEENEREMKADSARGGHQGATLS